VAENTAIEWCDHTFNPWTGCTKVSSGCAHCYAEVLSKRAPKTIGGWGKGVPRKRTSLANWELPRKWNRAAEGASQRPRVFCASLADWLDDEVPLEWLKDLLVLIQETPHLDWLLLTKRPENFTRRIADVATCWQSSCELAVWWECGVFPLNVWLGTTVEDQPRAEERIPLLLSIPAKVRFLSCEPLLEPVDLALGDPKHRAASSYHAEIHWVICGGESGHGARPMHPEDARSLRDQCQAAGVPFLFKQWGECQPCDPPGVINADDRLVDAEGSPVKGKFVRFTDPEVWMRRVGKKAAGRLLDGREWNEFPRTG
jgi:protein gp37